MTTYNRIIRKMVVGFGNIFNGITLTRYDKNENAVEEMKVPLAYAPKERYVMRLESDPDLDKKVQITLPRMSFEMTGLSYDSTRKQITNVKNYAPSGSADTILSQYNPVPYDFDFSLYLYVRNIEDGTQIIERILPFFTPDYTIRLNLVPEMGIVKDIPVLLKNTDYEINYEGDRDHEVRTIIWTLNFTVKGYIFGAVSEPKIIKTAITNIFDATFIGNNTVAFNMDSGGFGSYQEGEIVYQGFSLDNSTASAKVLYWEPNTRKLTLVDIQGHFTSDTPIRGQFTNANHNFNTYQIEPQQLVKVTVTPDPESANAQSDYGYTIDFQEFPDIE